MAGEQSGGLPETNGGLGTSDDIGDEELLARFVALGEELVDGNNRIKKGALKKEQFQQQDGWSFSRLLLVADIKNELAKLSAQKGKPHGYALIKAGDIRAVRDSAGQPAFCVIPDPLPENPAHALAQRARDYNKREARSIRDLLLPKFSEVKTA